MAMRVSVHWFHDNCLNLRAVSTKRSRSEAAATNRIYDINFDTTIRHNSNISDNEVLIEVDGDDFLPDRKVFTRINNVYKDTKHYQIARSQATPCINWITQWRSLINEHPKIPKGLKRFSD